MVLPHSIIMKPGVYENISNTDYHDGEGLSSSQIKVLALKTPRHFWYQYVDEEHEREVRDLHGPLAVGTLFHTLLLEPETQLDTQFLFIDEINRRSKAGKEAFEAAHKLADGKGLNIITAKELENVQKMVAEARRQPLFNSLFTGGRAELSCYWIDEDTGLLCKCRPDYLHSDNIIVDLKSCMDASEEGAGKAAFNFGYYLSAAYYLDGVAAATGKPAESFIFSFMEKAAPFCCAPYVITEEDIALGRMLYKNALKLFKECTEADRWPGYTTAITELEIPAWARKKIRKQLQ